MSLHASLARARRPGGAALASFLDPRGARVIVGSRPGTPVAPIAPARDTLFAPRGACLGGAQGPLFIADTGHHRLLIWERPPAADGAPADTVIGQPDFTSEGRRMLNMPTGVDFADGVLALADAWNHRVLLWHGVPTSAEPAADVVLSGEFFWPFGVKLHEGRLYVADTGNRRVLAWDDVPRANRRPDRVVREAMRWPHAIAFAENQMFVADAGEVSGELNMPYGATAFGGLLVLADTANSRLLGYRPGESRPRFAAGEETWGPARRDSLYWPYAVAGSGRTLVVADTGNNRVLLWDLA